MEIEKMYENAGVLKECLSPCYINKTWRKTHNCPNCDNRESYPPFTAEKQIEILKFLFAKDVFKCYQHYTSKAYIVLTDDVNDFICNKPFDEFLASYINYLW